MHSGLSKDNGGSNQLDAINPRIGDFNLLYFLGLILNTKITNILVGDQSKLF